MALVCIKGVQQAAQRRHNVALGVSLGYGSAADAGALKGRQNLWCCLESRRSDYIRRSAGNLHANLHLLSSVPTIEGRLFFNREYENQLALSLDLRLMQFANQSCDP